MITIKKENVVIKKQTKMIISMLIGLIVVLSCVIIYMFNESSRDTQPTLHGTYQEVDVARGIIMVFQNNNMTVYEAGGGSRQVGSIEQAEDYEDLFYIFDEDDELDQIITLTDENTFYYYDEENDYIRSMELVDEVPTYVN